MQKRKQKKKQVQFQRKVSAVDSLTKKLKRNRSSRLGGTPGSETKKERKGNERYKGRGERKQRERRKRWGGGKTLPHG